jgi:hypothetical protein
VSSYTGSGNDQLTFEDHDEAKKFGRWHEPDFEYDLRIVVREPRESSLLEFWKCHISKIRKYANTTEKRCSLYLKATRWIKIAQHHRVSC